MKMTALALAFAVLLAACSTTPTLTPNLEQARADYSAASADPQVAASAPLEFRAATQALERANAAAAENAPPDEIDKLAYLAKQRIATAREVARTRAAEAEIANARQARTEVQLQARTAEADRAQRDAATAQAQAASAQQQVLTAQQQAEQARMQAEQAQQQSAAMAQRTAQLEKLLVELQAVKTERGYVVTIGDVLFAVNRADLAPSGMSTLRKLADVMAQNPERTVLVEGFTDSTGSTAHNQELSERRAASVASALADMGVPRARIAMRAYGETFPVASNASAGGRQANRRVEIVLSNPNAPIPPRAPAR